MFITSIPVPVKPIRHVEVFSFMEAHIDETIVMFEEDGEIKAMHDGVAHPALALLDSYPTARYVAFLVELPHQFYIYAALHVKRLQKLIVVV